VITNKKLGKLIDAVKVGQESWAQVFLEDQDKYKQETGRDFLGNRPMALEENATFSKAYSMALKDVVDFLDYFYETKIVVPDDTWG